MHKIWISLDTGIDDAFALILALKEKNIQIEGISATYGNVCLKSTFENTRNLLSYFNREDIKVYKGSDKPLVDEARYGSDVHGRNGIGNVKLSKSKAKIEEESSFDAIYKRAKQLNGELELVMLGPSTDFANTYFKHPDVVKYIKNVYIMGGAIVGGNRTSQAEFNIHADPIASKVLFDSGLKIIMAPLDVTMVSYFDEKEIEELKHLNNKVGSLFKEMSKKILNFYKKNTGKNYFYFHDGCPIVFLSDESIFKTIECGIKIETKGKLTYGKTVCDYDCDNTFNNNNAKCLISSNKEKFVKHCFDIFKSY